MKPQRIAALIIGCVLLLPGIGILIGAGVLGSAWAFARNDEGYFQTTLPELTSSTAAITATGPVLSSDMNTRDWLSSLDIDVRLRVTPAAGKPPLFVGIGPATDVAAYLSGTSHQEITALTNDGRTPVYRTIPGEPSAEPPQAQTFWAATGSQ
jgi:hypothetical protein